jgi:DNA-binding response OmpR family regulator
MARRFTNRPAVRIPGSITLLGDRPPPESPAGRADREGDAGLLVADDDEDILALVQLRLSRSGFEVIVARDGEEALRLAQERLPDLAVLDWMMPKASGLEVLRAIRANSATAGIPVVLLTARASEADVQEGLDAGADDYIAKPFSPQELAARVQTILGA